VLKFEHILILEVHIYIFLQIYLAACPCEVATVLRRKWQKQHIRAGSDSYFQRLCYTKYILLMSSESTRLGNWLSPLQQTVNAIARVGSAMF